MAWRDDQLLEVDRRITECFLRLGCRARERAGELRLACDDPHPLATATGHCFHHHRKPDLAGEREGRRSVCRRRGSAGNDGDAGRCHPTPCLGLVAHGTDRGRWRADPDQSGALDCLGEHRAFREKAVTGMYRVGPGPCSRVEQAIDRQVALGGRRRADGHGLVGRPHVGRRAIGRGVDGDGLESLFMAGADDAERDLAAIGDEDPFHALIVGRLRAECSHASSRDCGPAWSRASAARRSAGAGCRGDRLRRRRSPGSRQRRGWRTSQCTPR